MKKLEKDSQRARVKQLLNYATLEGTSASEGACTALARLQLLHCMSNMQPLHTVARTLLQQVRSVLLIGQTVVYMQPSP